MAKTIKSISCPNCKSVDKKELGDNRFRCENCNTEYFLDDDYTHVVHHHKHYGETLSTGNYLRKVIISASVSIAVFIAVFFIVMFISRVSSNTDIGSASTYSNKIDLVDKELVLCKTKANKLLFVLVGIERSGSYPNYEDKLVAYFYDKDAKKIKKQDIDFSFNKNVTGFPFDKQYMSNGDAYIMYNEKSLFKVDVERMEVLEMKDDFFNHPELASGVAKIEKYYDQDGFKLLSQDGKSYAFLPIINKLIPSKEIYKNRVKLPPNPSVKTCFKFNTFDSNNRYRLFMYKQKQQTGYLIDEVYFDFEKDNSGGRKSYLRHYTTGFVDYKLLSERIYFNAKMLGYDDNVIFISNTTDAADNSSNKIQKLNAQNGDVLWTLDLADKADNMKYTIYKAVFNEDYVILKTNFGGLVLDNKTGKEVAELKYY